MGFSFPPTVYGALGSFLCQPPFNFYSCYDNRIDASIIFLFRVRPKILASKLYFQVQAAGWRVCKLNRNWKWSWQLPDFEALKLLPTNFSLQITPNHKVLCTVDWPFEQFFIVSRSTQVQAGFGLIGLIQWWFSWNLEVLLSFFSFSLFRIRGDLPTLNRLKRL